MGAITLFEDQNDKIWTRFKLKECNRQWSIYPKKLRKEKNLEKPRENKSKTPRKNTHFFPNRVASSLIGKSSLWIRENPLRLTPNLR